MYNCGKCGKELGSKSNQVIGAHLPNFQIKVNAPQHPAHGAMLGVNIYICIECIDQIRDHLHKQTISKKAIITHTRH